MYPYNRNTWLYQTKVQAKEEAPLSADRRLMELLQLALEATDNMFSRYQALMAEPALAESADILKTMLLDEQKHARLLKDVIFSIQGGTGAEETEKPAGEPEEPAAADAPASGGALLEDALLTEMDDIGFFRDLLLSLPEAGLRDPFYEIVTDKQNHCSGLCFLYTKYFS